jgi:tetratricopeptide (TPR) repeat protein
LSAFDLVASSLAQGIEHHRGGRLDQAELIYRWILDDEPSQPDALHLLGLVCHQRGRHERAVALIRQALEARPEQGTYHGNLAEAYRALGKLAEARAHAETAVRLMPQSPVFQNTLGLVLQGHGLQLDALRHFNEAIRLDPAFALAHNNLGLSLRDLGRPAEGLAAFREAVRLDPSLPEGRNNLGQMLLERHEPDEALVHCQEALRLRPGYPEAMNNLGNVLRELGRLDEAKVCYEEVLRVRPGQAMTLNNMGQALQEEGRVDEALVYYQRAVTLEPNSARFLCNLASALHDKDQSAQALELCRRVLQQIQPDYVEGHQLHASLREEDGDLQGAVVGYREALRLEPDNADTHVSLGHMLAEQGELEQALGCFREALEHEPRHPGAHAGLATSLGGKMSDDELAAAVSVMDGPLSERQRATLGFGLAHALDGRGRHAEAAQLLRRANACRQQVWTLQNKGYDPAAHDRFVAGLMANFSAEYFATVRGWGLDTDIPVFIVGLPRSGTTLTEQILASHPQVHGAGELSLARETFDAMPALLNTDATPVECSARYQMDTVRQAASGYLERLRSYAPNAGRIVDKMPDNYLYLGLLVTLFPKARIIHTRRDERDTAVSCWMTDFKQIRWACDLGHIAARVAAYHRLMRHWRAVLPVPMLEVDYEETVADLESVARRLIAWCGLEWHPACLEFHKTQRPIRTASVTQVRQPIYKRSVARWKNYAQELEPLLEVLSPERRG